jgi:hypothetical protein
MMIPSITPVQSLEMADCSVSIVINNISHHCDDEKQLVLLKVILRDAYTVAKSFLVQSIA